MKEKNLKVSLVFEDDDGNQVSREISGNWTIIDHEKAYEKFNINIKDEVAYILAEQIKVNINQEFVKNMINEMGMVNECMPPESHEEDYNERG
jgi:hypothetical protein